MAQQWKTWSSLARILVIVAGIAVITYVDWITEPPAVWWVIAIFYVAVVGQAIQLLRKHDRSVQSWTSWLSLFCLVSGAFATIAKSRYSLVLLICALIFAFWNQIEIGRQEMKKKGSS